nr:MAG TPA: hypothetical protein [Caudoviricetes sp.]
MHIRLTCDEKTVITERAVLKKRRLFLYINE